MGVGPMASTRTDESPVVSTRSFDASLIGRSAILLAGVLLVMVLIAIPSAFLLGTPLVLLAAGLMGPLTDALESVYANIIKQGSLPPPVDWRPTQD